MTVQESEIKSLEADGLDILDLLTAWNKDRNVQFGLLIRTTNDKINYLPLNTDLISTITKSLKPNDILVRFSSGGLEGQNSFNKIISYYK